MIVSTAILIVSSARIPQISKAASDDSLYHLVCNDSNILHVFHYPIKDGRVTDDLVFHPLKIYTSHLTETAIDYMTPMCQRLSINTDGINHEWFISSEKFTKPIQVKNSNGSFIDLINVIINKWVLTISWFNMSYFLFQVIQQQGNNTDEEIRYNRMKRYVIAKMQSEVRIIESDTDGNKE